MRQQAERTLRVYFWTAVVLAAFTASAAFYVDVAPIEVTPRVALLSSAKPVPVEESAAESVPEGITIISYDTPAVVEVSALPTESEEIASPSADPGEIPVFAFPDPLTSETISLEPQLPQEYDQYNPSAELSEQTTFSPLSFATDIDDSYRPVAPRRLFGEGFFTIYATFLYEAMADGMAWSWVWRHNGQIVNGGNELWSYGDEGPGWIYYAPPEGFQEGEYTLEVWVNGELFSQSSITVEPGVANQ